MTLIDSVLALTALLIGGAGGWLIAVTGQRRSAERQRSWEEEVTDQQELYAAWAMLRRTGYGGSSASDEPEE
jgi:hypothetical protein